MSNSGLLVHASARSFVCLAVSSFVCLFVCVFCCVELQYYRSGDGTGQYRCCVSIAVLHFAWMCRVRLAALPIAYDPFR